MMRKQTRRSSSLVFNRYAAPPTKPCTKQDQSKPAANNNNNSNSGTSVIINKKPSIKFPTSPSIREDEIIHADHPQHPLAQVNTPSPFTCTGCKEHGAGPRFTCNQCNFELHQFCALAPPFLRRHPLHTQHHLYLISKPGGIRYTKCDVCGKATKGYMFQCNICNFQMHPCCAMLSSKMNLPVHPHTLTLIPAAAIDPGIAATCCRECKRKRSGQIYSCTICNYHLHAVCAKSMINGLHANGIKSLDRPSKMGAAVRIAAHLVMGFMSGIIEGIGEGVGEAIAETVVKGNASERTRPTPTTVSAAAAASPRPRAAITSSTMYHDSNKAAGFPKVPTQSDKWIHDYRRSM